MLLKEEDETLDELVGIKFQVIFFLGSFTVFLKWKNIIIKYYDIKISKSAHLLSYHKG